MKKVLFAAALISVFACKKNEDNSSSSTSISEVIDASKNLNKISGSMDEIQKNSDRLKDVKVVSNDDLKAVFPESILGLQRKKINIGDATMLGISSGEAEYSDDADKTIEVNITDGAGEAGSAMLTLMAMTLRTESEKQEKDGYEKITNYNGVRAIISESLNNNEIKSEIQYILKDRYTLKLEAEGYSLEQLKQVMSLINTNHLK